MLTWPPSQTNRQMTAGAVRRLGYCLQIARWDGQNVSEHISFTLLSVYGRLTSGEHILAFVKGRYCIWPPGQTFHGKQWSQFKHRINGHSLHLYRLFSKRSSQSWSSFPFQLVSTKNLVRHLCFCHTFMQWIEIYKLTSLLSGRKKPKKKPNPTTSTISSSDYPKDNLQKSIKSLLQFQ